MARSFDTWAANHKKIYFTDVTDLCAGATDNECAAAEVYIYPDREFSAANDLARPSSPATPTPSPSPSPSPNPKPKPKPNPNSHPNPSPHHSPSPEPNRNPNLSPKPNPNLTLTLTPTLALVLTRRPLSSSRRPTGRARLPSSTGHPTRRPV